MADAATAIADVIDPLKSSFSELQGNRYINICAAGANLRQSSIKVADGVCRAESGRKYGTRPKPLLLGFQ